MKLKLKIVGIMGVLAIAAQAGEVKTDKDLKKVLDEQGIYVETSKPGVKLSGYVDAGYTYNFVGGRTQVPMRGANDGGQANESKGDFNIHNVKLAFEKELPESKNEWAAGFRVDLNFGEDPMGPTGGTPGDGASQLWLQQAYVTLCAPIGNGLDFKIGKWACWGGLEAPERPSNLNITTGMTQSLIGPGEVVGVASSYEIANGLTVVMGVGNGDWSHADGVGEGSGAGSDKYILTGGLEYENSIKNVAINNYFFFNPSGGNGALSSFNPAGAANQVQNNGTGFYWNQTGTWSPQFANDKLLLGYNGAIGFFDDYANAPAGAPSRDYNENFWGLAGYAKYKFNKVVSLAARAEYVHNTDGAKFGTVGSALTSGNLEGKTAEAWGLTTTLGFDIWENVLLRAEHRVDWTHVNDPSGAASADGDATQAHLFTAQVVYSF